jgi:dolichyl-phosphate-mannose-protein mannosyltransferase
MHTPCRSWQPSRVGEAAVVDFGVALPIKRLCAYVGLGTGSYLIEFSVNGTAWERPIRLEQSDPWGEIEWRAVSLEGVPVRWIRVLVEKPGLAIGELAVFDRAGKLLMPVAIDSFGVTRHPLFNEPSTAVSTPSRSTGTYFDEVYFARAGLEIAGGRPDPEKTHPPLAKLLIAAGILLFGPNPFGWRFFEALAGALSVPMLYLLARRLFGLVELSFAATLLFCFDFMRYVQSRIATPDIFVLFFTLLTFLCVQNAFSGRRPFLWLIAAGISLGAGAACKWSAFYAIVGVAVLFMAAAARRKDRRYMALPEGLLCLAAIPAAVYLGAYVPAFIDGMPISEVIRQQLTMFGYHAGISQSHQFSSPWWQWPLVIRPVWLYEGLADLPQGMVRSIATFGNPAVWWPAFLAVLLLIVAGARRRDRAAFFIAIAFASLYLPWAVAPRKLTFIYHYLPCVPFAALALARIGGWLMDRAPRAKPFLCAYLGLTVLLFAAFLPILWGLAVPVNYIRLLQWLPGWTFWR